MSRLLGGRERRAYQYSDITQISSSASSRPPDLRSASMLKFGSTHLQGDVEVPIDAEKIPPEVNWIDAICPTADEIAFVEGKLGIKVPTLERLSEIETSSRLYTDPRPSVHVHADDRAYRAAGWPEPPLGFVLGRDFTLSVRFDHIKPCDDLHAARVYENGRGAGRPNASSC